MAGKGLPGPSGGGSLPREAAGPEQEPAAMKRAIRDAYLSCGTPAASSFCSALCRRL